jgi:hypothetical protein
LQRFIKVAAMDKARGVPKTGVFIFRKRTAGRKDRIYLKLIIIYLFLLFHFCILGGIWVVRRAGQQAGKREALFSGM